MHTHSLIKPFPAPDQFPNFLEEMKRASAKAYAAPGRLFAEWDLRHDLGWPTAYIATLAMAEKDDGGFWKFIKALVNEVEAVVEDGRS